MRLTGLSIVALTGLLAAAWSPGASAGDERDFIFTDDEGHLVLRFAGSGPGGPDIHELEEVVNQSFSVMVHDRLRADLLFEAEAVDPAWAASTEPRVRSQVGALGRRFSSIDVECRSASCRVLLEHVERLDVAEHQALVDVVQGTLEPLIGGAGFTPVFLIAAYEQQFERPLVKVYLRRATAPD